MFLIIKSGFKNNLFHFEIIFPLPFTFYGRLGFLTFSGGMEMGHWHQVG